MDKLNLTHEKPVKFQEVQALVNKQQILDNKRNYYRTLDNRSPVFHLADERQHTSHRLQSLTNGFKMQSPFPPKRGGAHESNLDQLFQLTAKAREFLPYFTQALNSDRDIVGKERKALTADRSHDSNFKAYLAQMRSVMRADEERQR